jgi:hypothetical protein
MATVVTIVNYDRTVITIVNYDPKTFTVQATGGVMKPAQVRRCCFTIAHGRSVEEEVEGGETQIAPMT